jgi:hypothetical protein
MLISAWDEAHREFAIALEGLSDEDLWTRPHPRLLSVGELAGHLTYWQSKQITGHLPPEEQPRGVLVDPAFGYYTNHVEHPVKLEMGVEEVGREVKRVHVEARAALIKMDPGKDDPMPGRPKGTWENYLQYQVFHVAYHTGQVYSVRHLLGHATTDN